MPSGGRRRGRPWRRVATASASTAPRSVPTRRRPCPVPSVTPPRLPPKSATGRVAGVYAQLADDFGIERAVTFVVLSPAPGLIASTSALMREFADRGRGQPDGEGTRGARGVRRQPVPVLWTRTRCCCTRPGDHQARGDGGARGHPRRRGARACAGMGRGDPDPGGARVGAVPLPVAHAPPTSAPPCPSTSSTAWCRRCSPRVCCRATRDGSRAVRSLAGQSIARTVGRQAVQGAGLELLDKLRARSGLGARDHRRPGLRRTAGRRHRGGGSSRRGRPDPRTGDAPGLGQLHTRHSRGTHSPTVPRRGAAPRCWPRWPRLQRGRGRDGLASSSTSPVPRPGCCWSIWWRTAHSPPSTGWRARFHPQAEETS